MAATTITFEPMASVHLAGALALSRQANWPHRREDWEMSLSVSQGVVGLDGERVVATIMVTPYGEDGATINLVIVDDAMRGRGLGRKLMAEALALAGERICYLVATQDGLPLYEKLGFVAIGEVVQLQGQAPAVAAPEDIAWAEAGDLARLVQLDRAAYGHDRSNLMQELLRLARFAVIRDAGEVQAFAAIRDFGRGQVIGPVVARSDDEARTLVDFLLAQNQGRFVRVDASADSGLAAWLTERGLANVGGGIVMRRATDMPRAETARQHFTFALASQALG